MKINKEQITLHSTFIFRCNTTNSDHLIKASISEETALTFQLKYHDTKCFYRILKTKFYETIDIVEMLDDVNSQISNAKIDNNQYYAYSNKRLVSKSNCSKISTINSRLIGSSFDTIELSLPNVNKSNLAEVEELLQTIKLCLK